MTILRDHPDRLWERVTQLPEMARVGGEDVRSAGSDVIGSAQEVEVPNLEVTLSMADVGPWQDWHRSFLIEGNCTDADELNGAITFLAPDLLEELARIELVHVGLVSLDTTGWNANQEQIARFTVELYVEQMRFEYLVPAQ